MKRTTFLILWLISDALLFVAAYVAAYFLRVGWILSSNLPFSQFITATLLGILPWLAVLATTRTFALTRSQATARNAAYIFFAAVMGVAFVTLSYFFVFQSIFSRALVVLAMVLNALATWLWHMVFAQLMRTWMRTDPVAFPTLIVGITRESRAFLALLQARRSPIKPVAILDASGGKESSIEGVPVLGKLNKLEEVLREKHITHLVQCSDLEQSVNLLSACRNLGITYMLLPSVLGIVERDESIESIEGKAVVTVSPASGWWHWFFR